MIISTGVSLFAIITMAFYMGAKTETLATVAENQAILVSKLETIDSKINAHDIKLQNLSDSVTSIGLDVSDMKKQIYGRIK